MSSWRGRRALVTGATGVIGSWLVSDLLSRGAGVSALVLPGDPMTALRRNKTARKVRAVRGRLEDFRSVERAVSGAWTVFHLGALTLVEDARKDPRAAFEANIRGTYHVLEACRRRRVPRVVIASSDKAYGAQSRPYVETMPLAGSEPYEVSKSCADMLARCYHRAYGLPVAVARCGNVYGGGDLNWSRLVPGVLRDLLRGRRPRVRSDGRYVRDYIYVKDAARAYRLLAERLSDRRVRGEAFNFSDEDPRTVLDMVRRLRRLTGRMDLKPVIEDRAVGEIRSQRLVARKARRLLGWRPAYTLDEGLQETIEWYRSFFSR